MSIWMLFLLLHCHEDEGNINSAVLVIEQQDFGGLDAHFPAEWNGASTGSILAVQLNLTFLVCGIQ
jgi:hypothetical protein